ncbi:2-hydroxymuconate tautomerase family protein [Nevskia sp.]|uniref:2-hydroxymuconate tautomerase family protein n=1 Tax=Nevskia sp. TaxID=1929292 RepID=UPI0025ED0482|nr:2-hydroxymuconate tautomerase family protein [Nevskia sp.]
MTSMPIIQVNMLEGRTVTQKRALHAALTEAAVAALGVPKDSVRVMIHELGQEHFALAGITAGELPLSKRRRDTSPVAELELEAVSK